MTAEEIIALHQRLRLLQLQALGGVCPRCFHTDCWHLRALRALGHEGHLESSRNYYFEPSLVRTPAERMVP